MLIRVRVSLKKKMSTKDTLDHTLQETFSIFNDLIQLIPLKYYIANNGFLLFKETTNSAHRK